MLRWKDNQEVDGLLFKYKHFYGSFDYVATSSRWYRNEIRIVKNNRNIYSYRDAQGFRKDDDKKLKVKATRCLYVSLWLGKTTANHDG
jgi:hypothetical protein